MGGLDGREALTPLGRHLTRMPVSGAGDAGPGAGARSRAGEACGPALTPAPQRSPLCLAARPQMDPRLAKALIFGCLLGCLEPVLTVAAALAHGRPVFLSPQVRRRGWEKGEGAPGLPSLVRAPVHMGGPAGGGRGLRGGSSGAAEARGGDA
jgi:hypothetical protein